MPPKDSAPADLAPDPTRLVATRLALHAVAEHVLAADLYARTGRIGLRVTPGGFGTPVVDTDAGPHRVRVNGTELVVEDGASVRSEPLTTVARAAEVVGIDPGGPAGVYELSTPLRPDEALDLDPAAAEALARWYDLGDRALWRLADAHRPDGPTEAQLWPEHFDLGLQLSEVNYGVSPGDPGFDQPYLYVGPWAPPPVDDFWNEGFGRRVDWAEIPTTDAAVAAFETGRERLGPPERPAS